MGNLEIDSNLGNTLEEGINRENVPEGSEEGNLTLNENERKENVIINKNDRSFFEFYSWYKDKRLIINPEWQRNYVWNNKRASKLIESFLSDIPVPVIYLAKNEDGNYEVIDGVQRLTSTFKFIDGEFALSGLEKMSDLNRKKYGDLPPKLQNKIKDTTLRTFELSENASKNLLFIIFERLNTGGVALNEMEIRNCIYRGELNNLIKRMAEFTEFTQAISQRDISKRMNDRALVLRFLAFYEKGYQKAQSGLKAYLNDFFEVHRNPPQSKLNEFETAFKKSMKAAFTVFGDKAFRLRRSDAKGGGEWATRMNASVFQVLAVSFSQYDLSQITQRSDAIFEEYLDLVYTDTQWVDYVSRTTGDPERIRYTFSTWNQRLETIMRGTLPKDNQRIFSRQLKEELFNENPVCKICNQEIKLINDAALDHEEHYWRGGKTIPTNARLTHRLCNLKRPH